MMRKFKKAIVRPLGNHYVDAISRQPNRSPIEVEKALEQHSNFVRVLKELRTSLMLSNLNFMSA